MKEMEKHEGIDWLCSHFNDVKLHFAISVPFNLNKTLLSHSPLRLSFHTYTYSKLTLSTCGSTLSFVCTHKRLYQHAMCLKCCFYIAAIFHFGLLSLNCLWGFVWGEVPSHLYMRLKERKLRWATCLCSYSFSLPSFLPYLPHTIFFCWYFPIVFHFCYPSCLSHLFWMTFCESSVFI